LPVFVHSLALVGNKSSEGSLLDRFDRLDGELRNGAFFVHVKATAQLGDVVLEAAQNLIQNDLEGLVLTRGPGCSSHLIAQFLEFLRKIGLFEAEPKQKEDDRNLQTQDESPELRHIHFHENDREDGRRYQNDGIAK
jgi:hypothetical protein